MEIEKPEIDTGTTARARSRARERPASPMETPTDQRLRRSETPPFRLQAPEGAAAAAAGGDFSAIITLFFFFIVIFFCLVAFSVNHFTPSPRRSY